MKQKIIPIVSVLIGVLAFVLTNQYLRGKLEEIQKERDRLRAGTRQISVAAAARDIPGGTVIAPSDLRPIEIPEIGAPDRVVVKDDGRLLLGKKTLYQIKANRPIVWSDIEGGAPSSQGLSSIVQHGMRAISLAVAGANAVSSMVEPNDRVDVLGTFSFPSKTAPGEMETVTLTMLQDVTVLATGQTLAKNLASRGRTPARNTGYSTVTLEVTPREAELLVFAQQLQGRITLALRNNSDVTYEQNLPEINFKYLENKLPELNQYRQQKIRRKSGF